ncbi:Olfactory receptor 52R1 [Chelonia mydas]|uniref:Olfactory receptor n=1 Tax=Chelonia mydas TaxID=8469 RepID=M7BT21_CHEMY|nr:Olfactory receptor 52R1 [Chelonia mydas]
MSDSNTTELMNPSTFILLGIPRLEGIPGLEAAHVWISIPFCAMYTVTLLGNFTILFIVKTEPSLHAPMYYFLCMLAVTDLVRYTSTMPKILAIFWFNSREINFSACLTQMYFIHCFSVTESGILVAMALDRYVAICHPLRHSTILSNLVVVKIGLAVMLRSGMVILPFPFLVRQWPYCRTNIIPEPYCMHIAVAKLACADTHVSSYYGLFVTFGVTGASEVTFSFLTLYRLPFCQRCLISHSYCKHMAVVKLRCGDATAFSTCTSLLCVILAYYSPGLFIFLTHPFGLNVPHHVHILVANLCGCPPMPNPVVYGVKTKQIRESVLHIFQQKGI